MINLKDIKKYPELIDVMMYCNNATKENNGSYTGDSVEVALSTFLTKQKINIEKHLKENLRKLELPFDSDRKMMSTIYPSGKKEIIYTKGGLESILSKSSHILIDGKFIQLSANNPSIFAYARKNGDDAVVVIGNLSKEHEIDANVYIRNLKSTSFISPVKMGEAPIVKRGKMQVKLKPYETQVYLLNKVNF